MYTVIYHKPNAVPLLIYHGSDFDLAFAAMCELENRGLANSLMVAPVKKLQGGI